VEPARTPRAEPRPQRLSTLAITLIATGAVIVGALAGFTGLWLVRPAMVDFRASAPAGSTVVVTVPDAAMSFHPSGDGRVHVTARGWATGKPPRFAVETRGDTTRVDGHCVTSWFARCSLRVDVGLPPGAALDVTGANGAIRAAGLDGALRLRTTNGALQVTDVRGSLELRSVNGAIRVQNASSQETAASTTNGSVSLSFRDAPHRVDGRTINGSVTVRLPAGTGYSVDAHTVNGQVRTDPQVDDPSSPHTVRAETVNGPVTVESSGR
jgi:hypothetical protein